MKMALTKNRMPVAIIAGTVAAVEAKSEYDGNGRQTGNVARYDVTIMQENLSTPEVRFPLRADAPRVPDKGERVALVVEMGETREWGANFRVLRYADEADLQAVASYFPAVASSKG